MFPQTGCVAPGGADLQSQGSVGSESAQALPAQGGPRAGAGSLRRQAGLQNRACAGEGRGRGGGSPLSPALHLEARLPTCPQCVLGGGRRAAPCSPQRPVCWRQGGLTDPWPLRGRGLWVWGRWGSPWASCTVALLL